MGDFEDGRTAGGGNVKQSLNNVKAELLGRFADWDVTMVSHLGALTCPISSWSSLPSLLGCRHNN